jgi:hypothetical protein
MAAVTADQIRKERATNLKEFATAAVVTGQTVYIGTLVCFPPGSARVRNGAATANYTLAGICEEVINDSGAPLSAITGNTAGTVRVRYSYGHEVSMILLTAARTYTNLNKTALLKTNNELDGTAVGTAAVRVQVGAIVETDAASLATVWVAIRRFGTGAAAG